ncbi:MAG: glutathione S-transferase family protein [Armatimonadetes bacterium]|nr:glutathione S-transferase family protein [Armatimonadota bacterium]
MIKLYQFPPVWGLPNLSPFCWKVENYLRMAGIEHQLVSERLPHRGPKGKLPFIEHHGRRIPDSNFIIDYLKCVMGDPLDGALSPEQKGLSRAILKMVEEDLYWVLVYERWLRPEGWERLKPTVFAHLPGLLQLILPPFLRARLRGALYAQGTGRHTPQEVTAIGKGDVDALAWLLGDKAFFLGEEPASIDASVYAFLGSLLWAPIPSRIKDHLQTQENLVRYCERMKERYYS